MLFETQFLLGKTWSSSALSFGISFPSRCLIYPLIFENFLCILRGTPLCGRMQRFRETYSCSCGCTFSVVLVLSTSRRSGKALYTPSFENIAWKQSAVEFQLLRSVLRGRSLNRVTRPQNAAPDAHGETIEIGQIGSSFSSVRIAKGIANAPVRACSRLLSWLRAV